MAVSIKQTVTQTGTTSSVNTTFTTTADILPGEDIFIALGRATQTGHAAGISNITTSAGAGTFERVATSIRASTFDLVLARLRCTTLIPSGSTITAVSRTSEAKRGGVMQVVSGLKATYTAANASSGNAADNADGGTSSGPNGSSTAESGSTTGATTAADCLVLGVGSVGGTSTVSAGSGFTQMGQAKSASGTSDRGCILEYKIVSATGVQTATATLSATGGWAMAVAAFEIEPDPPAGHTDEFTATQNTSGTSLAIPVPRAVPVGSLAVVSFAAHIQTGSYTITDSRGNTYTVDDGPNDFGLGPSAAGYARQGQSRLSTALQAGDTITITATGATPAKWAAVVGIFSLPANAYFGDVDALETLGELDMYAPPVTSQRTNALVVISHYMVNSGRTLTAKNGWTLSAKAVTTAASANRAVVQAWKYFPSVISTPLAEMFASYDTSGDAGHIARVFETPAPALVLKRWTGSAWETVTPKRWTGSAWETITAKEL